MDGGSGKMRIAALFVGAALLCGCAVPRTAEKGAEPEPEVRLPVVTPLKIHQPTGPPVVEPSNVNSDVEDGRARSLRLFQINYDREKAGPAAVEDAPGPQGSDSNR